MSKFFAKKSIMRKCWICKGPNPPRANDHMYCEVCLSKRCCVCRKIKLFQVNLVTIEGMDRPICPRHFGSFSRYRTDSLNMKWLADEEFKEFIEKAKMDRLEKELALKGEQGQTVQSNTIDIDAVVEEMFGTKKKE